MKVKVDWENYT